MPQAVRVRDCMRPGALAVACQDSVNTAFAKMRGACLDAVPVISGYRVVGILEQNGMFACQNADSWCGSVPVASLMRRGNFVCHADDTLEHALAIMARVEVNLLAVVDRTGQVVGVLEREWKDDVMGGLVPAFYRSY